jgi:hypothetical protein
MNPTLLEATGEIRQLARALDRQSFREGLNRVDNYDVSAALVRRIGNIVDWVRFPEFDGPVVPYAPEVAS